MEKNELVDKAILETIFLWQRSEYKYYKAIQLAYKKRSDDESLIRFAENEYYNFLNDYGVRRSLPGTGKNPVRMLVFDMFKENGFAEKVKRFEANPSIIDDYCTELSKKKNISGGKKLLSLITKTAFILRPNVIPLFDRYAKESLKQQTQREIKDFKSYYEAFKEFKKMNIELVSSKVESYDFIFNNFKEFSAFNNIKGFISHRSIDKILWMIYYFNR